MQKLRTLLALLPLLLISIAIFFVHRELVNFSFSDLRSQVSHWPNHHIAWAVIATLANYAILSTYDLIGIHHLRKTIGWIKVFRVSFLSFSVSNLVGHSLFSGPSMRMRHYLKEGLTPLEVTQVSTQNTLGFWLGFLFLVATSLILRPKSLMLFGIGTTQTQAIAIAIYLALLSILAFSAYSHKKEVTVFKLGKISSPGILRTVAYLTVSICDFVVCAAVLYLLLPPNTHLGFAHFVGIFVIAQIGGILSQVPGGLGVFDGLIVKLLSPYHEVHGLLSSLVLFRIIYYLMPFAISLIALATEFAFEKKSVLKKGASGTISAVSPIATQFLAIATTITGLILLLSGVLPAIHSRIQYLGSIMPLFVIEFSHLAASITGLFLLFISGQLWHRNRRALNLVQILLIAGIVTSLLKGLDYEEAGALFIVLCLTYFFRGAFNRRTSIDFGRLSLVQSALIFFLIGVCVYAGFAVYKQIPYSQTLWLNFHIRGDAERFLRSSVLLAVAMTVALGYSFVRGATLRGVTQLSEDELETLRQILSKVPETDAQLSLLGDKRILFSANKEAFLMYGVQGNSWIALGDVYGNPSCKTEVMRSFIQKAENFGARPFFYEMGESSLPAALDLGLQVFKIGEEAHIELSNFSLEGSDKKDLRASLRKAEKEGFTFRVVPRAEVPAIFDRLKEISDLWLKDKSVEEKGFSLGFFSEGYVKSFPCAVVEKEGKILGFANLWTGSGIELSVDLMRYDPQAPRGVMDFLFTKILIWGYENQFQNFNFGVAPLAGVQSQPWSPLWYKLANFVFNHGERFYNFKGLRDYKNKYRPYWKMRFIAMPTGITLPSALIDVSVLIGGGWRALIGLRKKP